MVSVLGRGTPTWVKWVTIVWFLALLSGLLSSCRISVSECLEIGSRIELNQFDPYDPADIEWAMTVSGDFIDAGCPEVVGFGLEEWFAGCVTTYVEIVSRLDLDLDHPPADELLDLLAAVLYLDLQLFDLFGPMTVSRDFIDAGCPDLIGLDERFTACATIYIDGHFNNRDVLAVVGDFYTAGCYDVPPWND